MKLYRGLKTKEYQGINGQMLEELRAGWKKILIKRAEGEFRYPEILNQEVINLSKLSRFNFQNFTDDKEIAKRYAKKNNGILVEIDPSIDDILEYFSLEFQNYPRRRVKFEIVYTIKGVDLAKMAKRWNLKAEQV